MCNINALSWWCTSGGKKFIPRYSSCSLGMLFTVKCSGEVNMPKLAISVSYCFFVDLVMCKDTSTSIGFSGTIVQPATEDTDFSCTVALTDIIPNSVIEFTLGNVSLNSECDCSRSSTCNYLEITTSEDTKLVCPYNTNPIYRYHTTYSDVVVEFVTKSYAEEHSFSLSYRGK